MSTVVVGGTPHDVDLGKRIEWVLKNCSLESGTKMSRRAWALEAGLSHSQVTMMQRRLREAAEAEEDPPRFEQQVFEALAKPVGLRVAWLASGEGERFAKVDAADPYPLRAQVLAANGPGYPKRVLDYVRALTGYKGYAQFTWADWVAELQTAERRGGPDGQEHTEPDESPPARAKAKAKR